MCAGVLLQDSCIVACMSFKVQMLSKACRFCAILHCMSLPILLLVYVNVYHCSKIYFNIHYFVPIVYLLTDPKNTVLHLVDVLSMDMLAWDPGLHHVCQAAAYGSKAVGLGLPQPTAQAWILSGRGPSKLIQSQGFRAELSRGHH